jgi:hypothetical protein
MNTEYEKQLNILKQVTMTSIEKTEIRDSLMNFMASHPPLHRPIISRFFSREKFILSPYTGISMTVGKVMALTFLGLILTGGSITMASANSIPGELLYPIKISVKEKIEEVGKTSSKEKLAFKSKKVERRLEEIKKLSEKKDITKEEVTIAQAVLAEHVQDLKDTVTELSQSGEQAVILASSAELIPLTESLSTAGAVMSTLATDTVADTTTGQTGTEHEVTHDVSIETQHADTSIIETKVDPTIPDVSTITADTTQIDLKAILSNEVEKQITEIKKTVQDVAQDVEDKKIEAEATEKKDVIDTPPVNPELPKKDDISIPDIKKDILIEEPIKDTSPPVTPTATTTTKDLAPKKPEQKSFFKR